MNRASHFSIHRIALTAAALAIATLALPDRAHADGAVCTVPVPFDAAAEAACAHPPSPADKAHFKLWLDSDCYKRPGNGWVHDAHEKRYVGATPATAPHGRVTVYYSPEIYQWLKNGRPTNGLGNGAMMVKEMFDWKSGKLLIRTAALKQKQASYSGWYWWPGDYVGTPCIGCHASADNKDLTFAAIANIDGTHAEIPPDPKAAPPSPHPPYDDKRPPPPLHPSREFLRFFGVDRTPIDPMSFAFPSWREADSQVVGPAGPNLFLTSSNCVGCHDSEPSRPNMLCPTPPPSNEKKSDGAGGFVNLSAYAEWSASPMALSGRDPIFHAQLESEVAMRPEWASFLDDTCYGCHGVAGQRQQHIDLKQPFEHSTVYAKKDDPLGKYGILARDGVNCTACHHISAEGLGSDKTFTGQFATGPSNELYGPYDNVKTLPMKQSIGIVPHGGEQMKSSALCGSCHTVILPAVPVGGAYGRGPGPLAHDHEQTTYLEWRNSAYQDEHESAKSGRAQSCQSCHMPRHFDAPAGRVDLEMKIANIEEYLPHIANSLAPGEITMEKRKPYSRHTLVGLNLFLLRMFDQFANALGVQRAPPPEADNHIMPPGKLAQKETIDLAKGAVSVEIVDAPRVHDKTKMLSTRVRVTNLAGHKFPSGVGFRRAFVEFKVLDAEGKTLWASGRTNGIGALVDEQGQPLKSELTHSPAELQPHHKIITDQSQVQIYEERSVDDKNQLTTSFLSRFRKVKDNRLLPLGWSMTSADGQMMQPVGTHGDHLYPGGIASDTVTFNVPMEGLNGSAAKVQASVYYQAIPPYFLADRFAGADGPETRRLFAIASGLDVNGTAGGTDGALRDWKLQVGATAEAAIH